MKKLILFFTFYGLALAGNIQTIEIKKGFTVTYLMLEKQHIALPDDNLGEENNTSSREIQYNGGDAQ
jgi:hypothetical protein